MRELGNISPSSTLVAKFLSKISCIITGAGVVGVMLIAPTTQPVFAAEPVSYSLKPVTGSYKPDSAVAVELSISTTTAISGASVDVKLTNASFVSFNTASDPAFMFVDYNASSRDVVVICQNNNCPAGTYKIATLNLKAGQATSMKVALTPVETYDPEIKPVGATGSTYTYTIKQDAPATSPPSGTAAGNITTVPRTSRDGTIVPTIVTEEDRNTREEEIVTPLPDNFKPDSKTGTAKLPPKNTSTVWLVIIGVPLSVLAVSGAFVVVNRIKMRKPHGYITGYEAQSMPENDNNDIYPKVG